MSEGFKVVKRFFHWGPFTAIGRYLLCVTFSHFKFNATHRRRRKDVRTDVRLCVVCLITSQPIHNNITIMFTKFLLLLFGGWLGILQFHCMRFSIISIQFYNEYVLGLILYLVEPHITRSTHSLFSESYTHFMPNYVNQASPEQHLPHHRPFVCIVNCYTTSQYHSQA